MCGLQKRDVPTIVRVTTDLLLELQPYRYGDNRYLSKLARTKRNEQQKALDKRITDFMTQDRTFTEVVQYSGKEASTVRRSLKRIGVTVKLKGPKNAICLKL